MIKTYDEILTEMKDAFFEISGESVERYSELETRFKAVASELFSLEVGSSFLLKQMFPQTAKGEYLDFHAQLRGISRKTASKTKLTLSFYLNEPREEDTVIGAGCICASNEQPYIQFETINDAVIPAGELSTETEAQATECGCEYNVKEGEVTVIVNPPLGVAGVTNSAPFEYGFDDEGDDALRKRILSAYSIPSTGFSVNSLEEAVRSLDEILDCSVSYDGFNLTVTVKTKNSEIDSVLAEKIRNLLLAADLFDSNVNVRIASRKEFDIRLDIKTVSEQSGIEREAVRRIKELAAALSIGEALELNSVAYALASVDGLKYCEVTSPDATGRLILCEAYEYLTPENIEVSFYE